MTTILITAIVAKVAATTITNTTITALTPCVYFAVVFLDWMILFCDGL